MDKHSLYVEQGKNYKFNVEHKLNKIGVMIIGLCGNTSTSLILSLLAHKNNMLNHDYFKTSLSRNGMLQIGYDDYGNPISKYYKDLIPINDIKDICFHGWDILNMDLYQASKNNSIIDVSMREHFKEELIQINQCQVFHIQILHPLLLSIHQI